MYLSRVEISDFRAFPADFRMDIHAGPGVTLLVGQNGLGKSTFIEAIEWCLTGSVRRLADIQEGRPKNADYLRRRNPDGSQAAAYAVNLSFDELSARHRIARRTVAGPNLTEQQSGNTPHDEIVALLRAPSWREHITDLAQYLRLTHFLSQSVEQRFAARSADERWTALEAPAGTERLNRAREVLGSGRLTQAFNERVRQADEAVERSKADLERWKSLVQRRQVLQDLAGSKGGSDPKDMLPTLASLVRELDPLVDGQLADASNFGDDQESVLRRIAEALRVADRRIAEDRARAATARTLPQEWLEQANSRAVIFASQSELGRRNADVLQELGRRTGDCASDEARLKTAMIDLAEAKRRLANLESLQGARQELDRVVASIQERAGVLQAAEGAHREAEAALAAARLAADARRRLEQEHVRALAQLDTARSTAEAVSRLPEIGALIAARAGDRKRYQAEIDRLDADVEAAKKDIADLESQTITLQAAADQQRLKVTAVQSAVSVIAAHLAEDDLRCPVCAAGFAVGELQRLAAESASRSDPASLAFDSALKNAGQILHSRRGAMRALETELQRLQAAWSTASALENNAVASRSQVLSLPLVRGMDEGQLIDAVEKIVKHVEAEVASIGAQRAVTPPIEELDAAVVNAEADLKMSRDAIESIARDRAAFASREDQLRSLLVTDASGVIPTHEALAEGIQQSMSSLSEAEEVASSCRAAYEEAVASCESLRSSAAVLGEHLKGTERELDDKERLAAAILSRWRSAGLKGEPSSATLGEALAALDRHEFITKRLAAEHAELVRATEVWRQAEDLRQVERDIDTFLKSAGVKEQDLATKLNKSIRDGESYAAAVRAARDYKFQIVTGLQAESRRYTEEVLHPLNQVNAAFLRMFSCFSDFTIALDARTQKANVQLDLVVQWLSSSNKSAQQAAVRQYLSEGQLSALSVGLLFSMSSMYRWSRWRALLLDDPLQHNDVIHAAAFIEVLRGLVRFEGYQVILSTHDLELADFVRRKLNASKISCHTCQFVGLGPNGVIHDRV